jgi:cobyric acid synthase
VVPNIDPLNLPEEDSVSFKAGACWNKTGRDLDIAVIDLPHISNFTDFDALAHEPDAGLRVVREAGALGRPDAVILPGSKNTLADLAKLRETGLADAVAGLARKGTCEIVGVCAGLQMLGVRLTDPAGLESDRGEEAGLGLLDLSTELLPQKTLAQSRAVHAPSGLALLGYEIHHGVTRAHAGNEPEVLARSEDGRALAWGRHGAVWGTYLHGVFDQPGFRRWWLNSLRTRKGLAPLPGSGPDSLDAALDRLAATVRESLNMDAVYALLGL